MFKRNLVQHLQVTATLKFMILMFKSRKLSLTCDQRAVHLCAGVAWVSESLDGHPIPVTALQRAQLTVCDGAVGSTGSPVTQRSHSRYNIALSACHVLPGHRGCAEHAVQCSSDRAGCTRNYG